MDLVWPTTIQMKISGKFIINSINSCFVPSLSSITDEVLISHLPPCPDESSTDPPADSSTASAVDSSSAIPTATPVNNNPLGATDSSTPCPSGSAAGSAPLGCDCSMNTSGETSYDPIYNLCIAPLPALVFCPDDAAVGEAPICKSSWLWVEGIRELNRFSGDCSMNLDGMSFNYDPVGNKCIM